MNKRILVVLTVVFGALAVGLSVYYFTRSQPAPEDLDVSSRQGEDALPIYQEYQDTPVAVATNRYTIEGFERDVFRLASTENGVLVIFNNTPEEVMNLEIVEGPGEGYPQKLLPAAQGEYTEAHLLTPGRYVIADVEKPENSFVVEFYRSLEEAKAAMTPTP